MIMKKQFTYMALALALIVAVPLFAQTPGQPQNFDFASDFTTLPVAANVPGLNGTFLTYLAINNPTSSSFTVTASLYDGSGTKRDASITLAPGETKTYTNFLNDVFSGFTGGGSVTFSRPQSARGTHHNRFSISFEVRASGA